MTSAPARRENLMRKNRGRLVGGLLALTLGVVGTAGTLTPSAATPAQVATHHELHARIVATSAFPHVYGGARFESHRGWREFEIGLNGIQRLAGDTVTVRVHGTVVGRMHVPSSGHAHLYRHRGLPRMSAGNPVRVNTRSGALVSTGTFRAMHHGSMM